MFIVFEGIDGCGKTTIIKQVAKLLKKIPQYKNKILITREPCGTKIGENIKKIILKNPKIDNRTEALLYAASRRQHIVEKIKPNFKKKIILCDRFIDSSLVYQGLTHNLEIKKIWSINLFAIEKIKADITFVLDVNPKISAERIKKRKKVDRFDLKKIDFHQKAREAFLKISQEKNHILIDGNKKINEITTKIYNEIIKCLKKRHAKN